MGTVDITVSVADDWTYLGNTTTIFGNITDSVLGTLVTGNDSIIFAQLVTSDGGLFDLSSGLFTIHLEAIAYYNRTYVIAIWSLRCPNIRRLWCVR